MWTLNVLLLELILCIVLFSSEVGAYFWRYLVAFSFYTLNSRGFTFYNKKCNAILFETFRLGFRNFKPIFLRMYIYSVLIFFSQIMVICLCWYLHVNRFIHFHVPTARFLKYVWPFYNIMHERVKHISWNFNMYHLTFRDKRVKVLFLHIWNQWPESSFQTSKRSLNDLEVQS